MWKANHDARRTAGLMHVVRVFRTFLGGEKLDLIQPRPDGKLGQAQRFALAGEVIRGAPSHARHMSGTA
jgi:hypothetical protein